MIEPGDGCFEWEKRNIATRTRYETGKLREQKYDVMCIFKFYSPIKSDAFTNPLRLRVCIAPFYISAINRRKKNKKEKQSHEARVNLGKL